MVYPGTKIIALLVSAMMLQAYMVAQPALPQADDDHALVVILFTDFEDKPLPFEEIVLTGDSLDVMDTVVTNEKGLAIILLPEGDNYRVTIHGVHDEERYHVIEIPRIPGAQEVDVFLKYEPPMVVILDNIYFDTDAATLRPESFEELDRLFYYLQRKKFLRVSIEGHTDSEGDDAYNLTLSRQRALAVLRYLMQKGIDHRRMSAIGHGETKPLADNDTPEGRQTNRRVEVHFRE